MTKDVKLVTSEEFTLTFSTIKNLLQASLIPEKASPTNSKSTVILVDNGWLKLNSNGQHAVEFY